MKCHGIILGVRQRRLLPRLGPLLTAQGFYLAGGTAIALHLGHRRSVDLDWFAEEFKDPQALARDLRAQRLAFRVTQEDEGTLTIAMAGVKVTMLAYPYPLLEPLVRCPELGCRLASQKDLAAMKIAAVSQRGAKKDFVDIYGLALAKKSVRPLIDWYQKKFSVEGLIHVLCSLAYFDDADRETMPPMLWNVDWRTIKKSIQGWVQDAQK